MSELKLQIAELTKQVERLSRNRERQNFFPHRKRSKTPKKYAKCWYHFKFGTAAKRCQSPCNFNKSENSK